MKTLTEIIETLDEAIANASSDLKSDWIEDDDKREMSIQLQHLIIAKANLDLLAKSRESRLFNSSMPF